MLKTYMTDEAHKIWNGERSYEWVHVNLGLDIPPVTGGSYKFLVWDILKERAGKDCLISKYVPESFKKAQESDCAVCQIDLYSRDIQTILTCRLNWLRSLLPKNKQHDVFLESIAKWIIKTGGRKILLWGGIDSLKGLRKLLPHHLIAYAQRHYGYKSNVMFYDYCDVLIAQTPGQVRFAFENNERLTPYVITIPNGVEEDVFKPALNQIEKQAARKKLGIAESRIVAVFPSRVALHKGSRYLERLIEVSDKLFPEVTFLVVGPIHPLLPPYHYSSLTKLLQNHKRVIWYAGVQREEMPALFQLADVCLMPAVWREGFSMASIEAMSCGNALIAPNTGCYREIVRDGYNGYLCRPEFFMEDLKHALKKCVDDRTGLASMGENARRYTESKLLRSKVIRNYNFFLEGEWDKVDSDMEITF